MHGQSSILCQLSEIDGEPMPEPNTAANQYLQRINLKLSLLISLLADKATSKTYLYGGQIHDISEFGLSFSSVQKLSSDAFLELGLTLVGYSNRLIDLCGQITRITTPPEGQSEYIYGLKFFDIQAVDQDEIVQWIFKKQRNDIRKRRETI